MENGLVPMNRLDERVSLSQISAESCEELTSRAVSNKEGNNWKKVLQNYESCSTSILCEQFFSLCHTTFLNSLLNHHCQPPDPLKETGLQFVNLFFRHSL